MSDPELIARTRGEIAELVGHHHAGHVDQAISTGLAVIGRVRGEPDPVLAPMLVDALALTAFALLASGRYGEADALWIELIDRCREWDDPMIAEAMVFAWHGRIVAALNEKRPDDAENFAREMMALLRTRPAWGSAPLLHVAETGYALTGSGQDAIAHQLLASIAQLGRWDDPQSRQEMLKGAAYQLIAASHLGDQNAVADAIRDMDQFGTDSAAALSDATTLVLAGSKHRRLDAAVLLLAQKDLFEALERPEDAKRVTDQFIQVFQDSDCEPIRAAATALREDSREQ